MAGPYYVIVGTATPTVSPAFTLERGDRGMVLEVPSLTAGTEVRPQFSSTSGGPFYTLQRLDGSGLPFTAHSGSGPAMVRLTQPTPWGRLIFTGSVTLISTFTIYNTRP